MGVWKDLPDEVTFKQRLEGMRGVKFTGPNAGTEKRCTGVIKQY